MIKDPDSYDEGYRQAMLDVAGFIAKSPVPSMSESENMHDFWSLLRRAGTTDTSKFHIFAAGFRVARRELSTHIAALAKHI